MAQGRVDRREWLFANDGGQRTAVERMRHSPASGGACSRPRHTSLRKMSGRLTLPSTPWWLNEPCSTKRLQGLAARLLNDPQGFNRARMREIDRRVIGFFA